MVTVVRQRLPHALRSAHSVAIHSEKSDATKGRCPGRCQEAHRPHSDAYRLDHLVRASFAPWNLRPSARVPWRSSLAASQSDGTADTNQPADVRNDDAPAATFPWWRETGSSVSSPLTISSRCRSSKSRWRRPQCRSTPPSLGCLSNTRENLPMRQLHEHNPSRHNFITGNVVRLSKRFPPRKAAPGLYNVVAQLPERDGQLQYRIKSGCEPFYRTVTENELESDVGRNPMALALG